MVTRWRSTDKGVTWTVGYHLHSSRWRTIAACLDIFRAGSGRTSLLTLLTALVAASAGAAQERTQPEVTITGTVVDAVTGRPIPGVLVVVGGAGFRLETDAEGKFTLTRIRVGDYRLQLSHLEYQPSVGDFAVMRPGEFVTTLEPVNDGADDLLTGIIGVVSDGGGGGPVGGATVRVTGLGGRGTLTDARGEFSLTDLFSGHYVVEFSQLGYVTRSDSIQVAPGRVTNVRVSLSVDPVQLDPIEVTVERREIALQEVGFYARATDGFGEFIDREQIEQRAPSRLSDLFTRLIGVEIRSDPGSGFERLIMLRGGRSEDCFPQVVLDGLVVHRGGNLPAMMDRLLDPSTVAGIEVYQTQSGVPAQYGGTGASCGLIIIWTRR